MGRDITKPSEGVSNGGRVMPKPRLGVKVPYRNLTSQIVSKQDIENEIMERFKIKQEQSTPNSADLLFARKLTQRLAKKLGPTDKTAASEKGAGEKSPTPSASKTAKNTDIKNNSDLIAILEGDGDDLNLSKQSTEGETKEKISRDNEREIALKQLKELPVTPPAKKFFKSRGQNQSEDKSTEKRPIQTPTRAPPNKPSVSDTKKSEKKVGDVEPTIKAGMVIKTYTRKRKSSESPPPLPPKKNVATPVKNEESPTNVYMTKSSRIIKKKVIWDPDASRKSPIKSPKGETTKTKEGTTVKQKAGESSGVKQKTPEETASVKQTKTETAVKASTADKKQDDSNKDFEKKTPVPIKKALVKGIPIKRPKRLTEVDKLLMDEGAVNMLYDVKSTEENIPDKPKKQKSVISLDRAHKELMSKTSVIKNDLVQQTGKEVQKNLRKKESTPSTSPKKEPPSPTKKEGTPGSVTRNKSKDSTRSSLHSPPPSPFNVAEASRIIRRHSSSSFSSNDAGGDESDVSGERVTRRKASSSGESPKKKLKKSSDSKKEVKNNNNEIKTGGQENVSEYKTFTLTKDNHLVSIRLEYKDVKGCYFTEQVIFHILFDILFKVGIVKTSVSLFW